MTATLQRLAETTADPKTAAILFALVRGGATRAELRAFIGLTHPERADPHLASLYTVLKPNTLGRLVVMPPAQWALRPVRRMSDGAQLGLPTADDLVDTMAAAVPQTTPPPVAAPPPAVGDVTSRRFNVSNLERSTSKRQDELRDKVREFVGSSDYARYWAHPKTDPLFEDPHETLAGTLRYCIAREVECANPIGNRGAYLWRMLQEFRRQRVKEASR